MAKVFDLSDYLNSPKSKVTIGAEEYEITNSLNDILRLEELADNKGDSNIREFIEDFLSIAFGMDVAKELMNRNYSTKFYLKVIDCIKESISEESIVDNDGQNA